ncbi:protein LTV1 homolog [Littorina saxatilis]|uniref:Protein LTV1 homolog n=1 Tax=Littorina saxatilis TaxID=31220 RepID=A0AAN9B8B8_9CAEN
MPGRRKKHFKGNLRNAVIEKFTLGTTELDPSLLMPEDDGEAKELLEDPGLSSKEKNREEQQKYGIYFEDDYNYLQHMKDVVDIQQSEMKQLIVLDPKSGNVSEVSRVYKEEAMEPEDMLVLNSKLQGAAAASNTGMKIVSTQPELDPDFDPEVLAALEDDFNFEDPDNELEDDFMDLANPNDDAEPVEDEEGLAQNFHNLMKVEQQKTDKKKEEDEEADENSDADSNAMDCSDDDGDWTDDEDDKDDQRTTCSEFSSATVPRNKKLQLLDRHTEVVMQREYTEDQIGALDFEELNGRVTFESDLFKQTVKELQDAEFVTTLKEVVDSPDRVRPDLPESWRYIAVRQEGDDEEDEERERRHQLAMMPKKPQWDCVSILSTLSTTRNIPKTVNWPSPDADKKKRKNKTSVSDTDPSEMVSDSGRGLTLKEIEQQIRTEKLADAPTTYRPSGETTEEKKERKNAIKQHRRERRAEKKANKVAFQSEMHRQTKIVQVREAQEKVISLQIPN